MIMMTMMIVRTMVIVITRTSTVMMMVMMMMMMMSKPLSPLCLTGLEIATHWSPMQPKIECWRLDFQDWSPTGESRFDQ